MRQDLPEMHFRPSVSRSDWLIVLAALAAYSHNDEYRKVHERLSQEAIKSGMYSPDDLVSPI